MRPSWVPPKGQQRSMLVQCRNDACKAQVVVQLDVDTAHCSMCGNEWKWSKPSLYRGTRRAVK
jgi:hypothetical protein